MLTKIDKVESQPSNQEQLKTLIKIRKEILDRITHLLKRKHLLQAEPYLKPIAQEEKEANGKPRKMIKASTDSKQPQNQATPKKDQLARSSSQIQKEVEESEAVKKLKEQQLLRNKRLFGGLNLHLDKAKSKIQQQKRRREQTNKIYEKIQQRQKQASEQLLRQEIAKINNELAVEQKIKQQNSRQILKIQNLILFNSYIQYANAIKPFPFTKTLPSISWKPTQEIMNTAKKLLGEREKENQEKSKKILQSIEKYDNKFDYGLYILENQAEYYSNFLKNYYYQFKPYLSTEKQPKILWRPALDHPNLSKVKQSSRNKIDEAMKLHQQNCSNYYKEKIGQLKERREKGQPEEQDGERSNSQSPHKQEYD